MSKILNYKHSKVHYQVFGNGPGLVFAFPGYGKPAESLQIIQRSLGKKNTIVAVDIFGQGKSEWNELREPTPENLFAILTEIAKEENHSGKFSLLGYSLGGRVALCLAQNFPEQVNDLWLLASDGLKENRLYNFITKTKPGTFLFRRFVTHPGFVTRPLGLVHKTGLVPDSLFSFLSSKISSEYKRNYVYRVWKLNKNLVVDQKKIHDIINRNGIRVFMIFGKDDAVIPIKDAIRFSKKLKRVRFIATGGDHHIIDESINSKIEEILELEP